MNLYQLWAGEKLWSSRDSAYVVANNPEDAKNCMTSGSDSLWVSVSSCMDCGPYTQEIPKDCYQSCGAYLIS